MPYEAIRHFDSVLQDLLQVLHVFTLPLCHHALKCCFVLSCLLCQYHYCGLVIPTIVIVLPFDLLTYFGDFSVGL